MNLPKLIQFYPREYYMMISMSAMNVICPVGVYFHRRQKKKQLPYSIRTNSSANVHCKWTLFPPTPPQSYKTCCAKTPYPYNRLCCKYDSIIIKLIEFRFCLHIPRCDAFIYIFLKTAVFWTCWQFTSLFLSTFCWMKRCNKTFHMKFTFLMIFDLLKV